MATMIPLSLDRQNSTAGERKLFDLFRKTLPNTCEVRYEMRLGERDWRPDYVILDYERGILIVEIKDWGVASIENATKQQFKITGSGGRRIVVQNPDLKCQNYLRRAGEQLRAEPVLCREIELLIPIDYALALPNISRQEFEKEKFHKILPHNVLLREDLSDSGQPFLKRYEELMPRMEVQISGEQYEAIKKALFEDIAVPVRIGVERQEAGKVSIEQTTIDWYTMSLEQEQVAKGLGDGHRVLKGIAGTGKTLIILYRAKLLLANNPEIRILVLCWNTSLANYMKQLYDSLNIVVPDSTGRVQIQHFSEYCSALFRKNRRRFDHDFDSPDFMSHLEYLPITPADQFDAIYVDEAQDFRKEWIEFLYRRLISGAIGQRSLIISADDAQRIYPQRDFRWADLQLPERVTARGRSRVLKTIYRNSARVWTFAAFLQPDRAAYLEEGGDLKFASKGGYDPQLLECRDLSAQVEQAVEIVKSFKEKEYTNRNLLILYRHRTWKGFPIVERLRARLDRAGIPNDWISEDREAKSTFDWNADTIKISTVHSSKGMDSPIVIVLGAETFQSIGDDEYDEVKLMYVALTRAREVLFVLYSGNEGLVNDLLTCQERYNQHREAIISSEGTN